MSNKLYITIIFGLSFVCGVLFWLNSRAADKIDELTTKIALKEASNAVVVSNLETCNAKIGLTNATIKALSVQRQDENKINERIVTRVERVAVPIKDAACEEKLSFYERLLNEANNK
ncbi:hypothetical protein [Campylobacter concisus]|uniref:hypothetical protein n=1 Tax=Campylobacter concisus TaxID=199 RepID=UPI0011E682A1|nr:hypothetical protein [Campylobacter concisus]